MHYGSGVNLTTPELFSCSLPGCLQQTFRKDSINLQAVLRRDSGTGRMLDNVKAKAIFGDSQNGKGGVKIQITEIICCNCEWRR